eukprot:5325982-Pleurochrysis_carterae.AAC.2
MGVSAALAWARRRGRLQRERGRAVLRSTRAQVGGATARGCARARLRGVGQLLVGPASQTCKLNSYELEEQKPFL